MNAHSSGENPSGKGSSDNKGGPPELLLRVISALVLIAVALVITWMGGLAFALLCAAVSAMILYEFMGLVKTVTPTTIRFVAMADLAIVLATWFFLSPYHALIGLGTFVVLLAAFEFNKTRQAWAALGLAYAALPFMALVLLRGDSTPGLHMVLLLFACVWGTDALAYFAGRAIGGPKLAPIISPKKTWSGAIGGVVGAFVLALPVLYFSGYRPGIMVAVLIIGLSIASQIGDLGESWLKRRFDVKDSSKIIPGHGGVLDRLDGLIVAGIAAWLAGGLIEGELMSPLAAARGLFAAFVLP